MSVVAGPGGDGTVTIDLDWPNAQMAFRLVEAAQQTFLEARQRAEAAAIGESIGILERYSATLHENISHTLSEIQKAQPTQRKLPALTPRAAARSAAAGRARPAQRPAAVAAGTDGRARCDRVRFRSGRSRRFRSSRRS